MSNHSICSIDRTVSDASTLGQSKPGSNGNEGVVRIPQSSRITGALPSNFNVKSLTIVGWGAYPSVGMQSLYSIAPVDRAGTNEAKIHVKNLTFDMTLYDSKQQQQH